MARFAGWPGVMSWVSFNVSRGVRLPARLSAASGARRKPTWSPPSIRFSTRPTKQTEYTGRINRLGTGSVFWSPSCFVGSCGGAPLSIVKDYIDSQTRPA
ncbi:hypothetical protein ACFXMT_11150 [Streptomyces mirabilis]|uniref:hypothetical protein n=1 Tax=Streptomyces mirabilis TaxID=68239 RepID=UPI0036960B16